MAFEIYRRGQGKNTRLCTAFGLSLVVALGCYSLYDRLQASDLDPWVVAMVPTGLFAVLTGLIFWLVNKPTIADFMIAAEGELKKVSWSSRKEITISTFIVIVVVVMMAVFLGGTDLGFEMFFGWLLR